MKTHKYNRPLQISLAALAIGVSGLLIYETIHRPTQLDAVSNEKSRLSPRNRTKQTPQASALEQDQLNTVVSTRPPAPHLFHEFNDWAVQYSKATPAEQQQMLAHGEIMVKKRHEQMAGLIEKSPQVALDEPDQARV